MRRIRKQCNRCCKHTVIFDDKERQTMFQKYFAKSETFVCDTCLWHDQQYLKDHPEIKI